MYRRFMGIAVLSAFVVVLAVGLLVTVPFASAEDSSGQSEIDMETDDDGNGIPDEFEDEFKELLAAMSEMYPSDTKLEDIYDSKPYREIRGFYERLPIKAITKEGLDEIASDFRELAAANTLAKEEKAIEQLQKKQQDLIDNDRVYKQAVEYIKAMSPADPGEDAGAVSGASAVAGMTAARIESAASSSSEASEIQVQSSTTRPEDSINQIGDMLFRDAAASSSGSAIGFSAFYARQWSHVGMYDGSGKIYDSSDQDCAETDDEDDGVALRSLQEFYDDADNIMYAQLADSSWHANQAEVIKAAKQNYGTDCSTPFTMWVFSLNGTSSFFCSKLVWRAYLDDDDYPVDLDSNSLTYYWWLHRMYGWSLAWYIINYTVAPDEIALSPHVDRYYQKELD